METVDQQDDRAREAVQQAIVHLQSRSQPAVQVKGVVVTPQLTLSAASKMSRKARCAAMMTLAACKESILISRAAVQTFVSKT